MAGKVCSESSYSYPLIDGTIIFCENGSYGIKDSDGEILEYNEKYKYGKPLGHGVVLLSTGEKDFLFNRDGEPLPCGDIDLVGQPAIMCESSDHMRYNAEKYMFGKLLVKKGDKYGLIDTLGNWILNPEYEYLSDYNDPYYYIKKNGSGFLVKKATKQEILTEFEYISAFSDGLAAVSLGKKHGYIDKTGKLVIPLMKATYAGYFIEGVAQIRNEDKNKWIDKRGKEVTVTDREDLEYNNLRLKYDVVVNYKNGTSKRSENFIYSRTEGKYLDRGKKFYFYAARSMWIQWDPKDFDNPEAFKPNGGLINYHGKTVKT